jgi:hypothetical protein
MTADQIPKHVFGVSSLLDGFPKTRKNQTSFIVEKIVKNIVFIFEIKINGAVGNAGFPGDLGDG